MRWLATVDHSGTLARARRPRPRSRSSFVGAVVLSLSSLIFIDILRAFYGLGFCLTIGVKMENENRCVLCGISVLRRRKHILIQLLLERYRDHVVMLLKEIIPREIPFNGTRSVCHPCWLRLSRRVRSQHTPNQPVPDHPPQQVEAEPDHEIGVVEPPMDISFVALNGYKRASNTARRCVFRNCRMRVAHNVSLYARFHMLHGHNFYIPQLARVCNTHFTSNEWEDLLDDETTHENFNTDHVLDLIKIYKWGYENKKTIGLRKH